MPGDDFFIERKPGYQAPVPAEEPTLGEELQAGTRKGIRKLVEIVDFPLYRGEEDFIPLARVQATASQAMLSTQVQVDRNALVKAAVDKLPEFLKLIAEEEEAVARREARGW